MSKFNRISCCRICKNKNFSSIIDLGNLSFTGQFPKKDSVTETAPLELIKCNDCELVQLAHNFSPDEMYGEFYGYASSQNTWMINHLRNNIENLDKYYLSEDLILDIGSNDGTSLTFFKKNVKKIGFDPSAKKFQSNYNDAKLIIDFFNKENFFKNTDVKAKVIISYAMFYDLEDPIKFARDIYEVLDDEGIWNLEQSYLPSMLLKNSFDTICHEHLEYYSLKQIKYICEKSNLKILDISTNEANGGSFNVIVSKKNSSHLVSDNVDIFERKEQYFFNNYNYSEFSNQINKNKLKLKSLLEQYKLDKRKIYVIGASTKGNVLLQYYGIDSNLIDGVGEINPEKIGSYTPGSNIEIFHENDLLRDKNSILLILPWHFKEFFTSNAKFKNFTQVYPLPFVEVIN